MFIFQPFRELNKFVVQQIVKHFLRLLDLDAVLTGLEKRVLVGHINVEFLAGDEAEDLHVVLRFDKADQLAVLSYRVDAGFGCCHCVSFVGGFNEAQLYHSQNDKTTTNVIIFSRKREIFPYTMRHEYPSSHHSGGQCHHPG